MLTAFVSVNALYNIDSLGLRKLIGWDASVLKTSAVVQMLPLTERDNFYVRFGVRFHHLSPSVERKPEVSFRQITIAVCGASFGYILLGLLLLRVFQQMCLHPRFRH